MPPRAAVVALRPLFCGRVCPTRRLHASPAPGSGSPKQGGYQGTRHEPSWTGDAATSRSAATDRSRPAAAYTHVQGAPEPDSDPARAGYRPARGVPSGRAPRSSTSTAPPAEPTVRDHPRNPDGVGSSNTVQSLDDANRLRTGGKAEGGEHAKGGITGDQPAGARDVQYQKQVPPEWNKERANYVPPMDKKAPE